MKKLCLFIAIVSITANVFAQEVYSGTCGDNLTWTLTTADGALVISGRGEMSDFHRTSRAPWFKYRKEIKSVILQNGVTNIGGFAFDSCARLTFVNIPNSVTCISHWAFSYCKGLTSIAIPNSVTKILTGAFSHCSRLDSISIPQNIKWLSSDAFPYTSWYNKQPKGLVYINKILYGYKGDMPKNTSIDIAEGTVSISEKAFWYKKNLISITIPNSVTNIGMDAFGECDNLTSIKIPDSISIIGSCAFMGCSRLASIIIPHRMITMGNDVFLHTSWYNKQPNGLVYINKMLYTYKGPMPYNTSIEVPDSTVSILSCAFDNCINLTSITIPNSLISIGISAFEGCTNLRYVTLGSGIKDIGQNAFKDCSQISVISYATLPPSAFANSFQNYNNYLYVPCDSKELYQEDRIFGRFKYIECIEKGIQNFGIDGFYVENGLVVCSEPFEI